jgi:hypothetical protein
MVIDLRLHADFAELHINLVLLGLPILLGLFVLVPTEVHEARNGRTGAGCDLNKVDITLACHGDSFDGADYANLSAFFINEAYLRYPDSLIDSRLGR